VYSNDSKCDTSQSTACMQLLLIQPTHAVAIPVPKELDPMQSSYLYRRKKQIIEERIEESASQAFRSMFIKYHITAFPGVILTIGKFSKIHLLRMILSVSIFPF
jgi:hypothetical protein